MPQDLYNVYNSLSVALKQEAYDYIMFLSTKNKQPQQNESPIKRKGFGCLRDKNFWMSPDFDAPLDDFKDYM